MVWRLILLLLLITRAAQGAPLVVHPSNPRYMQDPATGKAILLVGLSHSCSFSTYHATANVIGCTFNYPAYVSFMQGKGYTYMRMGRADLVGADLQPWPRTGPGNATDGLPKVDFSQFNGTFFSTLRQRIIDAGAAGITVAFGFFDGAFSESVWADHLFNPLNNIQGIDGGVNNTQTVTNTAKLTVQDNFVRQVIDTINDLDNVIWEITNEGVVGSVAWQQRLIDLIRNYELTKPKQHLIGMSGNPIGVSTLFASTANWISPGGAGGYPEYRDDPPASTGAKVVITETDHIGTQSANTPDVVWKNVTRGNSMSFYVEDEYDDPPAYEPGLKAGTTAVTWLNALTLASMTPQSGLASTGYALVQPGVAYVVWQPGTGAFTVTLTATPTNYTVTWWRADTQVEVAASNLVGATGVQTFTPPFAGAGALRVAAVAPPIIVTVGEGGPDFSSPSLAVGPLMAALPLVTNHTILRGLLDWFRVIPPWAGGPRWYSLASVRTGTLTNMDAASGWQTTVRQGGDGQMRFDGTNDVVVLPGTATGALDLLGPFSIMAWVLLTDLTTTNHNIVNKGYTSGTNVVQLYFSVGTTPARLVCGNFSAGDHFVQATTLLTTTWTHVVCTYDGSTWRLYINGAPDAQTATSAPPHSAANVAIGGQEEDGATFSGFWAGALDDILLWNRALSDVEILSAYRLSRRGWPGVLRRQYDMAAIGGPSMTAPVTTPRPGSLLPFASPRKGR